MVAYRTMSGTLHPTLRYQERVVDAELDELLGSLAALNLEGPKGVGKTSTALHRGGSIIKLDDPAVLEVMRAQPSRLTIGALPIVVDEWQRYPASWDFIRRAIDDDRSPGRFILTGSATPTDRPTHSGAARIVPLRMRPLTLTERGVGTPTASMADLLAGIRPELEGSTEVTL